jgi:hypothetical protein
MPVRSTRLQRALAIREVVRPLFVGSMTSVRIADFEIRFGRAGSLAYKNGCDIWHRSFGKVMQLEWTSGDADVNFIINGEVLTLRGVDLVSLRAGNWDADLMTLISSGERKVYKPGPAMQAALHMLTHRTVH